MDVVSYKSNDVEGVFDRVFKDDQGHKEKEKRVYSNFLGFMKILEAIHTCNGPGEWAYIFEDDIMVTPCVDQKKIPGLLREAEAAATARGDAVFYAGICKSRECASLDDADLTAEGTRRCIGGCAHAYAVNTSKALEMRSRALAGLHGFWHEIYFDAVLKSYAATRGGLVTPAAEACNPNKKIHCGLYMQNRRHFRSTIARARRTRLAERTDATGLERLKDVVQGLVKSFATRQACREGKRCNAACDQAGTACMADGSQPGSVASRAACMDWCCSRPARRFRAQPSEDEVLRERPGGEIPVRRKIAAVGPPAGENPDSRP